ncbi:MAG TPA: hypothetical protein VFW81_03410 [Thermoanaerobaculia bacterium]|nr:hypothetical protein [Thermoanaerobaculia bacterium]
MGLPIRRLRNAVFLMLPLLVVASAASATTMGFYTLTPCRVVDTRNPQSPLGGPALAANTTRVFTVAGQCGIPTGAGSIAVNVTVTQATAAGNLRLYPSGVSLPASSSVNYSAGQTRANNGVYAISSSGQLSVYCMQPSGTVQLIIDVVGWFGTSTPPPTGTGSQIWARRLSGTGAFDNAYAASLALDGTGNVVVVGAFQGSVDFGGGSLTSVGGIDMFVAKYSASGAHLWSRRFGGASDDYAEAVTVDGAGDVAVAGYFSGSADFGSGVLTSAGGTDAVVAKYSSNGTAVWSRRFGGTGTDRALGIGADASNNLVLTGYFCVTVDFGGGPLTSAGLADAFLVKYSSTGGHVWSKRFGGTSSDVPLGIDVAAGGNIAMTGYFQGTANFGGQNLTSAGGNDIFAASYDSTGRELWSKAWGNSAEDRGTSIAIDGQGSVIVTGSFTGDVDFGGGRLPNSGGSDIFLVKYSSNGMHQWSRSYGTTAAVGDIANAVAVDGANNVLLTGSIVGAVDFGGGALAGNGSYDVFIAKFRSDASHVWSKRAGALYDDHGWGIAADSTGNVFSTGDFYLSVDFGGGALVNEAGTDSYIVKLSP